MGRNEGPRNKGLGQGPESAAQPGIPASDGDRLRGSGRIIVPEVDKVKMQAFAPRVDRPDVPPAAVHSSRGYLRFPFDFPSPRP